MVFLALMRRIDELFTAGPFLGSRRMTAMLRAEGHAVQIGWVCRPFVDPIRKRAAEPVHGAIHAQAPHCHIRYAERAIVPGLDTLAPERATAGIVQGYRSTLAYRARIERLR